MLGYPWFSVYCRVGAEPAAQRIPSDFANGTNLDTTGRLFIDQESTTTSCCSANRQIKSIYQPQRAFTHNKSIGGSAKFSPIITGKDWTGSTDCNRRGRMETG